MVDLYNTMRPLVAALSLLFAVAKSESGSGSSTNDNDDGITPTAIILIAISLLCVLAVLVYVLWPPIATLWTSTPVPVVTQVPVQETARVSQSSALPSVLNAL